jgi:hypothetical protein
MVAFSTPIFRTLIDRDITGAGPLRVIKVSIFGASAAAMLVAGGVLVENPPNLFANTTAYLAALSAPHDTSRDETPVIQSAADAEALPPAASASAANPSMAGEAQAGNEGAVSFKIGEPSEAEIRQTSAGAILGQFQAWAAGKDAQNEVRTLTPAQEAKENSVQDAQIDPFHEVKADPLQKAKADSVQEAQADAVQDARAEIQPVHKHRSVHHLKDGPVRHLKEARAEIRAKYHRKRLLRAQLTRAQIRPALDARAQDTQVQDNRVQDQPVQNAQPPSLMQSVGCVFDLACQAPRSAPY